VSSDGAQNDNLVGANGTEVSTDTLAELGARLVREIAAATGEDEDHVDAM